MNENFWVASEYIMSTIVNQIKIDHIFFHSVTWISNAPVKLFFSNADVRIMQFYTDGINVDMVVYDCKNKIYIILKTISISS